MITLFQNCEQEDIEAPQVAILSPATSSSFRIDSSFTIIIDAIDNVEVVKVELLIDGSDYRTLTHTPFEVKLLENSLSEGNHTLMAKASDPSGNTGKSEVITIEIIPIPKNVLSGTIRNTMGEGVNRALVMVYDAQKKGSVISFGNGNPLDAYICRQQIFMDQTGCHTSQDMRNTFSHEEGAALDSTYSDPDGFFEIYDLPEGEYSILIGAGGYVELLDNVTQVEGSVEYDFTLDMQTDIQVSTLWLSDLEYQIFVQWNEMDLPTISGYNLYERHFTFPKLEGKDDGQYIHPVYSSWERVNVNQIEGGSFSFDSEEYNGTYEVHVLPVNIEGIESGYSDNTLTRFIQLKENKRVLFSTSLTSSLVPIYIPDNTHEFTLHMGFFYTYLPLVPYITEWNILISEDGNDWSNMGMMDVGMGQPTNTVQKYNYGYIQSVSLNDFKGKKIYLITDPTTNDNDDIEIYNSVVEYSQDNTRFGSLPETNFSTSKTTIYRGDSIQFFDSSTNDPLYWIWDFGDGYKSHEQNPYHVYLSEGKYTVELTAINAFGSVTQVKSNYITVNKPRNLIKGIVWNSLGEPIEGVKVIEFYNAERKNSEGTSESTLNTSALVYRSDLFNGFETSDESPHLIHNSVYKEEVTDEVYTDANGCFELFDLQIGGRQLELSCGGYKTSIVDIYQEEGQVDYEFTLEMTDDLQVSSIQVYDRENSIKVTWQRISLSTIEGYNVYERHYIKSSLEGSLDSDYLYPVYTEWRKVNEFPVSEISYEFDTEEYNGKYGVYVTPINKEGVESKLTERTICKYVKLIENERILGLFYLTNTSNPVYIYDNTHDFTLHMQVFYRKLPLPFEGWEVNVSEDGVNWNKLGDISIFDGQSPTSVKANYYGYFKSISLNQYKGKTLYFTTDPESESNSDVDVINYISEYSQDGTSFPDIGQPPTAQFTVSQTLASVNCPLEFSDQSTNEPTSWEWDFGDGSTSNMQNPVHQYSVSGMYRVTLRVANNSVLISCSKMIILI